MPISKIEELIDKQDTVEIVRDQISAILAIEIDRQKDLAVIAGKSPLDWDIDIYSEKIRPWAILSDENGESLSETPLINVSFDNDTFDNKGSNLVESQQARGTFYLDCYAHVNKYQDESGKLRESDTESSKDADRVARIARNIIQAGEYTYLGLRGYVRSRNILRREKIIPSDREGLYYEQVCATRITLQVEYNEYSLQAQGVDLELLINNCEIGESGEIIVSQQFDYT